MRQNKYRITFRQQVLMLSHLLLTNTISIGYCIYSFGWTIPTYSLVGACLIVSIIPTIIIHCQYLIKNAGLVLTIDTDEKFLELNKHGEIFKQSFQDISKLIRTSSYGAGGGWYSFGKYRYYTLIFKDSSEYVLTCLLIPNIESNLRDILSLEEEKHLKVLALT